MINTSNISIYLSRLSSGKLTDEEFDSLLNYLDKLKVEEEKNSNNEPPLDKKFKQSLRKSDPAFPVEFNLAGEKSEDLFLVAAIENQLTESENIYFNNKRASDPSFEANYQAYKKTVLPIESHFFFGKNKLKKKSPLKLLKTVYWTSIAASLLLFIWLTNETEDPVNAYSSENKNKTLKINTKKTVFTKANDKNNDFQDKKPFSNQSNLYSDYRDTCKKFNIQKPILVVSRVELKPDSVVFERNYVESKIQNETAEYKNKVNNTLPLLQESEISNNKQKEILTFGQYVTQQINKVLFKKQKADKQDKYNVMTAFLKRTFNIDVKLKRTPGKEEKIIVTSLSIGKFKYQHN
jgi:hypothetical protein